MTHYIITTVSILRFCKKRCQFLHKRIHFKNITTCFTVFNKIYQFGKIKLGRRRKKLFYPIKSPLSRFVQNIYVYRLKVKSLAFLKNFGFLKFVQTYLGKQ